MAISGEIVCAAGRRCRQYRTCAFCARIRQSHVADLATSLLGHYERIHFHRFTPLTNSQGEIERIKAAIKYRLQGFDAVWSVERGEAKALLHINLLAPVEVLKHIRGADYHASGIVHDLRRAAAYMVKPSQRPSEAEYSGRQFGAFTSITKLLLGTKEAPIIQGAAIEQFALAGWPLPEPYLARQEQNRKNRLDEMNYEARARAHLPKLSSINDALKGTVKAGKSSK